MSEQQTASPSIFARHVRAGWPAWMERGIPFSTYNRANTIGASEIAALFGDKWMSPRDLWEAKVNGAVSAETDAMLMGGLMEEAVLTLAWRKGVIPPTAPWEEPGPGTLRYGYTVRHPEMPISASPDAVINDGRLIQIKTSRYGTGYGDSGSCVYPVRVWYQCQQEQFVTGARATILLLLVGGNELRHYTIVADDESQKKMADYATDWWHQYVVTNTPPPPTCLDDLSERWVSKPQALMANPALASLVRQARDKNILIKESEKILEVLKWQIQEQMGENESLVLPGGKEPAITWKPHGTTSFDSKRFRVENPELWNQYQKQQSQRTFLFKSQEDES